MKFGFGRPAQEIALSPLSDRDRSRAKVLVRGVYSQSGSALAGFLLIAVTPLLAEYHGLIPASAAILAVTWLVLQQRVARNYLDTLTAGLGTRRLFSRNANEEAMLDRDGLAKVVEMLADKGTERSQLAREILSIAVRDTAVLTPHLESDSPSVRRALYEELARAPSPASARALREAVLSEDPEDGALEAGLTALAAYGDDAAVDRARPLATGKPEKSKGLARAVWTYLAQVGALGEQPENHRAVLRMTLVRDGVRAAAMYRVAMELDQISGNRHRRGSGRGHAGER